jgi:hypothetical protein
MPYILEIAKALIKTYFCDFLRELAILKSDHPFHLSLDLLTK